MFSKIAILVTIAAAASAISPGYVDSAYALGQQAEHTVRGFGGLSSVSKQAKAIDSAYSTVRKSDIRYTNDAAYAHPVAYGAHPAAYGAYGGPALAHHGYASPAGYAPAGYAHGYASPALTHGYASPALAGYAGPVAHHGYAHGGLAHGYAAPAGVAYAHRGYAGPVAHHGAAIGYAHGGLAAPAAKGVVPAGLGVAYSPATAVATSSFSGYGVHYGY